MRLTRCGRGGNTVRPRQTLYREATAGLPPKGPNEPLLVYGPWCLKNEHERCMESDCQCLCHDFAKNSVITYTRVNSMSCV
jgi:hypothetical protein